MEKMSSPYNISKLLYKLLNMLTFENYFFGKLYEMITFG